MGCACGGSTRRWAATSGWHRRGQPLGRGAGGSGGSLRDPEQPGQAANGGGLVWGSPPPSPLSGRSCGLSAARRPAPRRCASLTSATACVWSAHRPYPKGSRSSRRRQALVPLQMRVLATRPPLLARQECGPPTGGAKRPERRQPSLRTGSAVSCPGPDGRASWSRPRPCSMAPPHDASALDLSRASAGPAIGSPAGADLDRAAVHPEPTLGLPAHPRGAATGDSTPAARAAMPGW